MSDRVSIRSAAENIDCNMTGFHCIKLVTHSSEISLNYDYHIDGLVQERRNSSALAMELRLSCINPSTWSCHNNYWINTFIKIQDGDTFYDC